MNRLRYWKLIQIYIHHFSFSEMCQVFWISSPHRLSHHPGSHSFPLPVVGCLLTRCLRWTWEHLGEVHTPHSEWAKPDTPWTRGVEKPGNRRQAMAGSRARPFPPSLHCAASGATSGTARTSSSSPRMWGKVSWGVWYWSGSLSNEESGLGPTGQHMQRSPECLGNVKKSHGVWEQFVGSSGSRGRSGQRPEQTRSLAHAESSWISYSKDLNASCFVWNHAQRAGKGRQEERQNRVPEGAVYCWATRPGSRLEGGGSEKSGQRSSGLQSTPQEFTSWVTRRVGYCAPTLVHYQLRPRALTPPGEPCPANCKLKQKTSNRQSDCRRKLPQFRYTTAPVHRMSPKEVRGGTKDNCYSLGTDKGEDFRLYLSVIKKPLKGVKSCRGYHFPGYTEDGCSCCRRMGKRVQHRGEGSFILKPNVAQD